MMKKTFAILLTLTVFHIQAQPWLRNISDEKSNFFSTQKAFYEYWKDRPIGRGQGFKPFKRWEWYWETRVSKSGEFPSPSVTWDAWNEYLKSHPEVSESNSYKTQAGANWVFKGPSTTPGGYDGLGRINCMAFHPTDVNTFWIGSPAGGLWKTSNGGSSWSTNTDQLPVLGVSDIAINPGNANIMYIATGDGDMAGNLGAINNSPGGDTKSIGVLKSTDGGSTWNTTGLNWNVTAVKLIRRLIINPINPQILLAAASDGIWRTTNGGTTWTNVQSGYFIDLEFKTTDPNYVYAATNSPWGNAEIYQSTDGGITWNNTATFPGAIRIDMAVTLSSPDLVDVVCVNTQSGLEGLYYSNNSGSTFTQYFYTNSNCTNNLLNTSYNASGCDGQGHYDLAYAINPNNSNDIWLGGVNVWNSTDAGNTFNIKTMWNVAPSINPNNVPVVHADVHYIAFHPLQSNTMFVCNDGGIYKTTNGGTSWTDLSNGLQISQIYRIGVAQTASENVIIGLQDNGSREVYNNNWYERTGGDGMDCAIDYTNDMIQYGSYVDGKLFATTDRWQNQTTISDNISNPAPEGAWVTPFQIDPTTPSTIYAGYDVIYKSNDRGNTWTQISPVLSSATKLRALAIAPSNSNYIYASVFDTLFLTTNGGANWFFSNNLTWVTPITNIAVSSANPQHVYCTIGHYTSGQKVFKSTDAGVNWTNFSGTLPNVPVNCIVYEKGSNERLYIGTDLGIFYRESGMTDWSVYNTGLPNVVVTDLEISYQDGKIWAGTYGRGLWSSDLASTPSPWVSFAASNTNICVGDCISFSDYSTSSPNSWNWSFPGSNTSSSTIQNPTNICYPNAGTYNVSLTATNGSGSGSNTLNAYIVVTNGPAAPVIVANPSNSFCQGNSASINVSNPCPGCTFSWMPGGQTGASITVTNSSNILVTATDNCGQASSNPITITVFPNPPIPTISVNGNLLTSSAVSGNQWYFNGSLITGATQQTYTGTQAGLYHVVVTDGNTCTAQSASNSFDPTSLSDLSDEDSDLIHLYPNPAQDKIDILFNDVSGELLLQIISIQGVVLKNEGTVIPHLKTMHTLNTSDLSPGNYILRLSSKDYTLYKKFTILR